MGATSEPSWLTARPCRRKRNATILNGGVAPFAIGHPREPSGSTRTTRTGQRKRSWKTWRKKRDNYIDNYRWQDAHHLRPAPFLDLASPVRSPIAHLPRLLTRQMIVKGTSLALVFIDRLIDSLLAHSLFSAINQSQPDWFHCSPAQKIMGLNKGNREKISPVW